MIKAVEALVVRANRVLLLQRKTGTWQFVTGGVKPGENEEAAMLREIEEETGLKDARIVRRLGSRKISIGGKPIEIVSYLTTANTVAVDIGNNPDREHMDFKWIRLDEVAKELQYEDQKKVVETARKVLEGEQN